MTTQEIIAKGEKQLKHIQKMIDSNKDQDIKKHWADIGIYQLDMLDQILDGNYEGYQSYMDSFICYKEE